MRKRKQEKTCKKACLLLQDEANHVLKNMTPFGFRERVRIERSLFLLLKNLSCVYCDYEPHGFSDAHVHKILLHIPRKCTHKSFKQVVEQIFQLKIFIKSISNENAYVRNDALARSGVDKKNILFFINHQSNGIISKIKSLSAQNNMKE